MSQLFKSVKEHVSFKNISSISQYPFYLPFVNFFQPSVDINKQDYSGNTALHLASPRKLHDAAKILIEAGADPHMENYIKYSDCDGIGLEFTNFVKGQTCFDLAEDDQFLLQILKETKKICINDRKDQTLKEMENFGDDEGTDSGFISSGHIGFLDDVTMQKFAQMLDPPKNGCEKLSVFLGIDENMYAAFCKSEKSPTITVLNTFQRNGGDIEQLLAALQFSELYEAYGVLKERT